MEHEKLAKSHGILLSVIEVYQFCSRIVPNLYVFGTTRTLSIDVIVIGDLGRRATPSNHQLVT